MNQDKAELHVIFGTGPVGVAVAQSLLNRGKQVKLANRSGKVPKGLKSPRVSAASCDLMVLEQVRSAAKGATHLYHCANPLYHQWAQFLPTWQENLITCALELGAVLTLSENLYMYARGVEKITEKTLVQPPTRKGKIRQDLSEVLEKNAREKGLIWASVRASDYYGPEAGYQSVFGTDRFLDVLEKAKNPAFLGRPDVLHSYTYLEDFGEALAGVSLNPACHGQAWICPNAPAPTTRELGNLFLKNWGGRSVEKVRFGTLPRWLIRVLGLFDPVVGELVEMLYQKEEPYVVDGSALEKVLGLRPTSLEDGVKKTIQWYQSSRQK